MLFGSKLARDTRMRPFARFVFSAALLLGAGVAAPAHAQVDSREGIALQNQIYQLRQQMQGLQDQVARGGGGGSRPTYIAPPSSSGASGDLVTQLLTRVDSLEEQVRQLRGQVQETQNAQQRQGADLGKRIDDMAFQSGQGGASPGRPPSGNYPPPSSGGSLAPPPGATATPPPVPPASGPGPRTPEIALQDGNAALGRRDYARAEQAAREVLANRTSPRAYDAQLLLAQALAGEKQYPQAAIAYDDAYNRSRRGAHAPDALLGLANSLAAINEKKAACDTLNRLRTEFPQPRPDIRESAAAARGRLGCG
jgi:TolA-binding protein